MGRLVEGKWETRREKIHAGGRFFRPDTQFRNWVTADGSPWADRRRRIQGRARPLSPLCLARLPLGAPHADLPQAEEADRRDQRLGRRAAHARRRLGVQRDLARPPLRQAASSTRSIRWPIRNISGRASVPVLWDKERKTIVSNESAEIIRMLNSRVRRVRRSLARLLSGTASARDRCDQRRRLREHQQRRLQGRLRAEPGSLRGSVPRALQHARRARPADRRAAFSDRRRADRGGLAAVHDADPLRRGLLRPLQVNRRRIADYPNLSGYLRDLYQMPGVKETVDIEHAKQHYYYSHDRINPTRIVPLGPLLIIDAPHDRDRFRGTNLPQR